MTAMTSAEIAALLGQLTDAEKVALTAGADAWSTPAIPRAGIPALRLGDGPHGVRKPHDGSGMSMFDSHPATCFPTAVTLGSTWDAALVQEVGEALGREAASHGIAVLLGPGVNLKRTPVGGRNFEYFSEDPLIAGRLGAAWVRGVQGTGVGASLKHLAANNTEQRRYGVNAVVDERALRELYLASFEHTVIQERPATVMAAYNQLNGEHCTENGWLLRDVLRGEWGFDGVVVSDWGAVWDRAVSLPAGNDLAMPGLGRDDDEYLLRALASGALARADLDAAVTRILDLVARFGGPARPDRKPVDLEAHHRLARRAAAAGTVLLKNEPVENGSAAARALLPLAAGASVAVIGAFAQEPRFQGAGSSHVVPTRVETLLEALTEARGASPVRYASGYDRTHNTTNAALLARAAEAARSSEVAIVVVGLPETFETEGVDRAHLRLPESHERLVATVVAANPATVVVLQNGSPVELPWLDSVPAVVEAYLGGQAGGGALSAVLVGEAEPGGRLAETFPVSYATHPVSAMPNGPATVEYRESLYLGYRYFDTVGETVAFPFGHGLSYTSFAWTDVSIAEGADGASAVIELLVANTGERAGSDVVQVYVHDVESTLFRPEQELRGFAKVSLLPGESERVSIVLDPRAFSYWDPARHSWTLEPGRFEVRVARSSRDVVWSGSIGLAGAGADGPAGVEGASVPTGIPAYRSPSRERGFTAGDFERLLGHPLPPNSGAWPGEYTLDTAVRDMRHTPVGRILARYLKREAIKTIGAPEGAPVDAVAADVVAQLNFRMFPTVSDATVSRRRTEQLLRLVNLLSGIRLPGTRRRS